MTTPLPLLRKAKKQSRQKHINMARQNITFNHPRILPQSPSSPSSSPFFFSYFYLFFFLLFFCYFIMFLFFFSYCWPAGRASCSSVWSSSMPQPVVSELGVSPSAGYLLNIVRAHSGVAIFVTEIMAARALTPLVVSRMLLRVRR
jgi:hypothetical protein